MFSSVFLFIILAIITILISLFILNSKQNDNDKVKTLIGILVCFSIVTMINEGKRIGEVPNKEKIKSIYLTLNHFERKFYDNQINLDNTLNFPISNEILIKLKEKFEKKILLKKENSQIPRFLLFYGSPKMGKTFAVKTFLKENSKNNKKFPFLYLEFDDYLKNIEDFCKFLKIEHTFILDQVIENINSRDLIPTIIFDNSHFLFNNESCVIFSILKKIYDHRKVNIIFITNNYSSAQLINFG